MRVPASLVALCVLLGLALLADPASAYKLRKRHWHKQEEGVTTTDDASQNQRQRPRPRSREGNATILVNATMPRECMPVEEKCVDELRPLADKNHNTSMADGDKDAALQDFCASECGQNYTTHIKAILQGLCYEPLPPRSHERGRGGGGVSVVVRTRDGNATTEVRSGDSNYGVQRVSTYGGGGGGGDDNDHDDNDDHDNEDEDEDSVYRDFERTRPGASLGCLEAMDGQMCAAKSGCDFFNSCCYASYTRLGSAAGYALSPRTIRTVEYFCPGSVRYIDVEGCA